MNNTPVTGGEQILDAVRNAMHGHDIRVLARRTALSPSTLYALRNGKTRWPRDYTLFAVTLCLGLQIVVRRKPR